MLKKVKFSKIIENDSQTRGHVKVKKVMEKVIIGHGI